ncbi:ribonuclease domain-containing protein [Streptomyces sp. E11-3]|uniref:ribonuclease domain-containing protein n=1 Tax=Streptomyces sp. E11-3 TaxID=3110112 RepID=UPI003980E45A
MLHGPRQAPPHRRPTGLLLALLSAVALLLGGCAMTTDTGTPGGTRTPSGPSAPATPGWARGMATVLVAELPPEARETLRLIDADGPFPYEKDGTTFGNFERLLPRQQRGYYREYTVRTPGERTRGARRLVTGDGGETYYTRDHYNSFKAVLR